MAATSSAAGPAAGPADMLAAFATAADAQGVAHEEVQGSWPEVGAVTAEPFERPDHHGDDHESADIVPFVRRQLCLGPERDAEVEALLRRHGRPQLAHAVTLWWDTA